METQVMKTYYEAYRRVNGGWAYLEASGRYEINDTIGLIYGSFNTSPENKEWAIISYQDELLEPPAWVARSDLHIHEHELFMARRDKDFMVWKLSHG